MTQSLSRACVLPLFVFVLGFGFATHAKGKVSLSATPVSVEEAQEIAVAPPTALLPELTDAAADLTPLSRLEHNGSLWLLADTPEGNQAWLSYDEDGWQSQSSPPGKLSNLQPGGQAHVLALGTNDSGNPSFYTYHTITNTWADLGPIAIDGSVQNVRNARDGFIITSRDDSGTDINTHSSVALNKRLLKPIDWSLIAFYLCFTAAIGFYYYRKDKQSTDNADFFLGGRNIPWWAAGVSLYATGTSAISYIATPAYSFGKEWLLLANNVVGMVGTIFVAIWIVPLIRRLSLMSVYHYLEMRFHPHIRVLASGLAIVLQLGGRMSIVLYLPSLAMSAVTGINVTQAILIMGVVTILYTALGGMKAVIWTDFIQVVVMLGGAFVAFGYIVMHVDGGLFGMFDIANADGKMRTFDWDFNLTQATVWGFLMLNILGVLVYPQDQVMMQRVLSTKSDKAAGRSVWTLAAIVVPGNLAFFGIGTALYVFYKQHPANLHPMLSVDSTFPQFIAAELPPGITGLIIAGIFAASMSTLSSCINSVATLVSVDFYERYAKKATQKKSMVLAEFTTVIGGCIGIGTALLLARANIQSALETSFALGGLLGGGFAGCYALGMFTKRANWQGAMIGVAASIALALTAWFYDAVHPIFYLLIANLTTIVVGYIASLMFPAPSQSLLGLTVYTPRKDTVAVGAN
ncbi:MAG: sodium:solute symporter [Verrucomicrobia bacterium]|nr:MAG: sodium:solute symporter [Verrucomicrobiota bacterium]